MQADIIGSRRPAEAQSSSRLQTAAAAGMAALLGAFLIWGVGFSPIAALHDAAHDMRHSMAFACH
jgi:cobalt transporter subunit CbtB